MKPGARLNVQTHLLDYFWTIQIAGRARNHQPDETYLDVEYQTGDTKQIAFAGGDRVTHGRKNIGETNLIFTTVEFKNSANMPLPLNFTLRSN